MLLTDTVDGLLKPKIYAIAVRIVVTSLLFVKGL